MKKFYLSIASLFLVGSIFVGCGDSSSFNTTEDSFNLSIFHVDDTHSHIESESMTLEFDGVETNVPVGGYARYVTKLNELKKTKPNSLTLNAGDVFQGTLFYSLFKGEADAAMMNLISWDAYSLGNHEFDDGDEGLKSFLDMLNDTIPVISANVVPQSGNILEGYWTPYVIKEIAGEKVGIIGIDIVGKTKNSSNPSDEIIFLDELETAQNYINELTDLGVNKIVLLTHQGYSSDLTMAKALNGVDVIIGGDSHTLQGDFSSLGLESSVSTYPTVEQSKDGKKVCIAHAWEYGHILGNVDVRFNKSGDVISCGGNPLLLVGNEFTQEDANGDDQVVNDGVRASILDTIASNNNIEITAEDDYTLSVVKTYSDEVDAKKAVAIGTASERLGHNRIPGDARDGVAALPLGSDIAPIVAKSFYDLSNLADACIQNAGGVRVAIEAGEITMGDAYTLLPFANTLFELQMYGDEIKQVLEDAITNTIDPEGSTGSFPYSYGLRYDVDLTASANNRISNLEIKNRQTGVWSEISNTTMYTIVTNSYTAGGKDGYLTFKTVQDERGLGVDTYLDYAMSFVKYMETLTANNQTLTKLPSEDHPIKSFVGLE
ncbi:NAD nucleotidase [Campylobacterota bacterium DY0563]